MSLAVPYENVDDARMRLQQTVVLYDGDPVYITDVGAVGPNDPKGDVFRVYANPLPFKAAENKADLRKFISSKKFDMAPFPMGFMNIDGLAVYCSRLPRRQQRQGLSNGTFSAMPVDQPDLGVYRLDNLVTRQEFVDCIKGKHPSFDDAQKMIDRGDANSVAFSRQFALVADRELPDLTYLYHKKDKVGFVMDGRIKLSKAGRCLVESLREVGVKC